MNENIEVYQLSDNNMCVTFNKNSLAAIKDGRSVALKVQVGKRELKMLFIRDTSFREMMTEYKQSKEFKELEKQKTLWGKIKGKIGFGRIKQLIGPLSTKNKQYKEVKNGG